MDLLLALDDFMYYPVLIVVLSVAGLIFSAKTGLVQILSLIHI